MIAKALTSTLCLSKLVGNDSLPTLDRFRDIMRPTKLKRLFIGQFSPLLHVSPLHVSLNNCSIVKILFCIVCLEAYLILLVAYINPLWLMKGFCSSIA